MDQNPSRPPSTATHEPVDSLALPEPIPDELISNELTASPFDEALGAGRDVRGDRMQREDGWTPEKIRIFLYMLAETGVVSDAARAAGMSKQSAYALRNSAKGRPFLLAWRAALLIARRRLADDMMSRAVHGCVEIIYRDGKVWGQKHRYDNRLSMAVLTRLDQLVKSHDHEDTNARYVAEEFDQFVDIVAGGGDGAAEFIQNRQELRGAGLRETSCLERAGNYVRYGVGHPAEIDTSDLEPARRAEWTDEQLERARRSGLLAWLDREEDEDDE